MRFVVTSLATARPVAGAQIRIEGLADDEYRTLAEGTTDAERRDFYSRGTAARRRHGDRGAEGNRHAGAGTVPGPEAYADNNWTHPRGTWLGWAFTKNAVSARAEKAACCATCSPNVRSTGRRSR